MPALSLDLNGLVDEAEQDSHRSVTDSVKRHLLVVKKFAESDTIDHEDKVALIDALTEQAKLGRRQTIDRKPLQLGAGTSTPQNDVSATVAAMGAQLGFDSGDAFLTHVAATYAPIARIPATDTQARDHRLTSVQAAAHAQPGTAYELDNRGNPVMPGKLRQAGEDLREEKDKVAKLGWADALTDRLDSHRYGQAERKAIVDSMLELADNNWPTNPDVERLKRIVASTKGALEVRELMDGRLNKRVKFLVVQRTGSNKISDEALTEYGQPSA